MYIKHVYIKYDTHPYIHYRNMNRAQMKEGDWICSCGEMNFASRTECRKCTKSKIYFKPGDWKCQCEDINFASRSKCRKCNHSKSGEIADRNVRQRFQSQDLNQIIGQGSKDWNCSCGEVNFISRIQCRKCMKIKEGTNLHGEIDTLSCKICFDAPLQARIRTCGHLSMCTVCAARITSCPMCRSDHNPDSDIEPTYIS